MSCIKARCSLLTLSVVCAFTLLACVPITRDAAGTIPATPRANSADSTALLDPQQAYVAALQDAKVATADEIFDGLTAIVPENDTLTWQADGGRLLMVTWTSWNGYDAEVGKEIQLTREVWATAVPELQTFCQHYQATDAMPLTLRLEALLGLPPNNGKTKIVAMWVNPADLFRPSPDGEITDGVAELELPGPERFPSQQDYEFHRDWYNLQVTLDDYDDPSKGYPWTRLGYTYDWGNPESEIGLSEFVITAGATVAVEAVYNTAAYCGT